MVIFLQSEVRGSRLSWGGSIWTWARCGEERDVVSAGYRFIVFSWPCGNACVPGTAFYRKTLFLTHRQSDSCLECSWSSCAWYGVSYHVGVDGEKASHLPGTVLSALCM